MLYKGRYRVESIRLSNWDYRTPGYYFITICVEQRYREPFGYIKNGYMCLSNIGTMAHRYWFDIPKHFPNVSLDVFVIMSDHMHGIIWIREPVETCHGMSLHADQIKHYDHQFNKFSKPISQSIPMIVNQYKSAVTRWCRQHQSGFQWQPRYYEHIIRNEQAFHNIQRYIINNPKKYLCGHG
jgi:REP element-mobilizing transposase RayT